MCCNISEIGAIINGAITKSAKGKLLIIETYLINPHDCNNLKLNVPQ